MEALFGSTLLGANGTTVSTKEALAGKIVGVYFSAHWCPPCRGFTPVLAESYKKMKAAGKNFEIVFASSDEDQKSFDEYFGEMPWLAIPFEKRDEKQALSQKYKVKGIPTFVILDESGEVITKDGRGAISSDPEGAKFPWRPPTVHDALGSSFIRSNGDKVSLAELSGKYIGIYFSAHWCPPCRGFTPQLVKTYNKVKADGKPFEIIFVSSDRNADQFKEYFGEMPWLALPYEDRDRKGQLSSLFEVSGIPTFVMLEKDTLQTISTGARGKVSSDPEGEKFPWLPSPAGDLEAENEQLNEETTLIALIESLSDDAKKEAIKTLEKVGAALKEQAKAQGKEALRVLYAVDPEGDVVGQIRNLTKNTNSKPKVVLLDIPDRGGFYDAELPITEEALLDFVSKYNNKQLDRKQLE